MNKLMKHTGVSLLLISFFLGSCASTYAPASYDQYDQYGSSYASGPQVQVSGSISFYDELSPYGRWVSYPGYDQVWIPNAGRDFRPYYTNGHWVYTDYGWTWMSDYSWGWAAFHYGRWLYDDFQGWMWVPGNDWGPAWVSWRTGGDYYGWAPMGPQYSYNAPANYWAFVPRQYINSPRINNYYVNNSRNVTIINNTTVINNYNNYRGNRVYTGPTANEVQRYSGQAVRPVRVENTNRPGAGRVDNNRLQIYRPDAAAIQRGREADRTRPVQQVDNSRPGRITPGNTGNNNTQPGDYSRPNRTTPGNNNIPANNNGGRINNQPVNNGNIPNNNSGRVIPGSSTQPVNNTPGTINRPSRTNDQQQLQRIQQQQQDQQRIQRDQQQQQQQRVQQQQQDQQRIQREQQQQQQRVQQQQQQDQQRVQRVQQQEQQQQQRAQQQQQRTQQQQQQQRVQREQQQQQQRVQQQQQRVQREQQQQQDRPQRQQ
ncbi:DUF6600 domain-containing protein [Chitinophaga sp.]|uniref:DUF6600 domain-containing protein n=1 Tax=Chitinophaga sp. TaxID=1869181 RepID=UPI002F951799